MADSEAPESEIHGKKKAKTGDLGEASSSYPSISHFVGGVMDDGDDDGGGEEMEEDNDPLSVFGSGIMMMIMSKLDARSVALSRSVSRGWLSIASSDKIWAPKDLITEIGILNGDPIQTCLLLSMWSGNSPSWERWPFNDLMFVTLFKDKRKRKKKTCCSQQERWKHYDVSPMCEDLWHGKAHIPRISKVQGLSKFSAYSLSVMDGKRPRITQNDLCDHVWEFHFTEAAPEFWRNLDPYWRGEGTPMRRYFHPDGSISADPDDAVWGGHESCYTIVTGLFSDGKIREHYVRINRWPQMTVKRKEDWGWELSNHLYCYTSVPDPDKEDGTGPFFHLF